LVEELEEKRCLASFLCREEHAGFYQKDPVAGKGTCALWAEAFAFAAGLKHGVSPELREAHIETKLKIESDAGRLATCRQQSHQLTRCMSKYLTYIQEIP